MRKALMGLAFGVLAGLGFAVAPASAATVSVPVPGEYALDDSGVSTPGSLYTDQFVFRVNDAGSGTFSATQAGFSDFRYSLAGGDVSTPFTSSPDVISFAGLTPGERYTLNLVGVTSGTNYSWNGNLSLVPIPAAAVLLGSAVAGLAGFGVKRRKGAANAPAAA